MQQLPLSFQVDEQYLKRFFENETGKNISLVVTDNSASMLSLRKKETTFLVRLHRIFLSAGKEVLDEITEFIKDKKIKTPHIRNFINQNTHLLKIKPQKKITLRHQGRYYNLLCIYNSLNEEYFGGENSASITWGNVSYRHKARKRTLGSCNIHSNMIRINPVLDTKRVPQYFLELVVYHEMLHSAIGIAVKGTRRTVHSKEFRACEKKFKHYEKALAWERKSRG